MDINIVIHVDHFFSNLSLIKMGRFPIGLGLNASKINGYVSNLED